MEIAFHEAGLNYGGGVANRVLKKLLRAVLILKAYHPARELNLYFASPKVHRAAKQPLKDAFGKLERYYPKIKWHLLINDAFAEQLVRPTLEKASSVADTSELFARAAKLLELSGLSAEGRTEPSDDAVHHGAPKGFQDLIQALVKTLLEDYPALLGDGDIRNLMDSHYCKTALGIKVGNFPLLRRVSDGRKVLGYARYYAKPYAGEYYLCSQFSKDYHFENAACFVRYLDGLIDKQIEHPGRAALEGHRAALQRFLDKAAGSGD